jgi:RNA polymerase sigma-70 factor (ECF subfamily)
MAGEDPRRDEPGTIQDLLARIREGDEDAARELLGRYEAKVRLVVSRQLPRLLRSRFDSLDFLQSVWGSFFQKIRAGPHDLHEEKNLVAFLAWAARNKVIDECRRATTLRQDVRRQTALQVESLGGRPAARAGETPSQVAQARETYGRLRDLLPENRRIILEMKAEGFSSKEIADRLGLSERTVQRVLDDLRKRANRGRQP